MEEKHKNTIDIESDPFREFVLSVGAFAERHAKNLIIAVIIIIVGTVGLVLRQQQLQSKRVEASVTLTEAFETFNEAENNWLDSDDANADQLQVAEVAFQEIFQRYKGSTAADQARYNFAKIKYYRGEYDVARTKFEEIFNEKPKSGVHLALYAKVAIGNCYEQQNQYAKAIEAYETLIDSTEGDTNMPFRDHIIELARLSQARCQRKLGQDKKASETYKSLIAKFEKNLDKAIEDKSARLVESAESLLNSLPAAERPPVTNPGFADAHYDTFVAYRKKLHEYKVNKDLKGGLAPSVRKKIRKFEKESNTFFEDLKQARENKVEGRTSTALYYYDQAVGLSFAPSRSVYEKALFESNKIEYSKAEN